VSGPSFLGYNAEMADNSLFLDYNSTTPLDAEVARAMAEKQGEAWGNPSSVHASGRAAKKLLEEARERVAAQIGCDPGELYFTSGGTESDNLAIKGCYFADPRRPRVVAVAQMEHPAVLEAAEDLEKAGAEVRHIPSNSGGVVTPEVLTEAVGDGAAVAAVMATNNETGTIQPVRALADAAHTTRTYFHCDAVQAIGKIAVQVGDWDVDFLALTGHKFYGPRGIGALYVRRGVPLARQISGGSHERKRRAGTENVIGAWGLCLALEKANQMLETEDFRLRALSVHLMSRITAEIPDVHFHGDLSRRVSNTVCLSFAGVEGESVVVSLDLKSICVASGSACSSGATEPSHVILAMGVEPQLAAGAVRVSMGRGTTQEHIDQLAAELPPIVKRLRSLSPTYPQGVSQP
jgi:cysteine desulfurase